MILSKENTRQLSSNDAVKIPGEQLFELPEKVLQFGTGVLLRGLPDYFIDKANKQGIFNGRIVVIKSTSTGGVDAFSEQDGLYTLCVRGVEGDQIIEENILNASISRVLSASTEWNEILRCATNPEIEIVISNTTEAGVVLTDDDIRLSPPTSFPGKLLACLHHRYKHFKADKSKGMIIIPTELLVDNGTVLKNILIELANKNKLSADFMDWLVNNNHFCNSLVDRIVPGKMAPDRQQKIEEKLGYRDNLLIMSESYRLWAIETNDLAVNDKLSFHKADEGVVITGDIGTFREVKLRLLNGSHTFTCGLAHLCGFVTVKEAMENKAFRKFITDLMLQEIVRLDEKWGWGTILVRIQAGKISEAIASIQNICKTINPKVPFTYQFSDQEYSRLYASEQVVSKLSNYFAFLAIFISCLGLFGLAAFTAEQRTKEIGVRKVLGASGTDIVALLSAHFLKPVSIAMLIGFPIAWYLVNKWLEDFAYKTSIEWWIFGLAGMLTIVIALLTVTFQSIKAALVNPVKSLRTE